MIVAAMCTLTIDCRCDTCIDGMIRYQCPRIIAVDAPPRSAVELKKLARVTAALVVVESDEPISGIAATEDKVQFRLVETVRVLE